MGNPIDYWYQKYLAIKAKMGEMMDGWLKDRDGCFWDGVEEGKKAMQEQMMEGAVEGEITKDNRGNNVLRVGVLNNGFEIGDRVKIIIVKEEKDGTGRA